MTGGLPDYVLLVVGANSGLVGMTKEHLGIALALSLPIIIAFPLLSYRSLCHDYLTTFSIPLQERFVVSL